MEIVAVIIVVVCIGAVAWAVLRRRAEQSQPRLPEWIKSPRSGPLEVVRFGRRFTARYTPRAKNTPAAVRISVPVDEAAKAEVFGGGRGFVARCPYLELRPETAIDRFAKRHGLNREISVGDAAFDAAVYIDTNSAEADVRRTLADPAMRASIRGLLDGGVQKVVLDPKGLHLFRPAPHVNGLDVVVDGYIERLAALADALPLFRTGEADRRWWWFEAVLLAFAVAWFVGILVFAVPAPMPGPAKMVGMSAGLAIALLVILVAIWQLRGRSDSFRRVGSLAITVLALMPWGGYELACWANQDLDHSPATDHLTKVVSVWTSKTKSRVYYHVDVASWRPGERVLSMGVTSTFADKAKPGREIIVVTHEGRLGWEWISGFRLWPVSR